MCKKVMLRIELILCMAMAIVKKAVVPTLSLYTWSRWKFRGYYRVNLRYPEITPLLGWFPTKTFGMRSGAFKQPQNRLI
jgi:hypothetical protein